MLKNFKRNDQIGLIFFIAFVIGTSLIYQFEEKFNEKDWATMPTKRHKLVDDLLDRELLIGKTKVEVINLLGRPADNKQENTTFIYELGTPPSFTESEPQQLQIKFKDERVFTISITP